MLRFKYSQEFEVIINIISVNIQNDITIYKDLLLYHDDIIQNDTLSRL